jgi:hypothetical protein
MKTKTFTIASAIAFVGVILFFNVRSAFAEDNNIEPLFGIAGAVALLTSAYLFISSAVKQNKNK